MIHFFRGLFRFLAFAFEMMLLVFRYGIKAIFYGKDLNRGIHLRKEFTQTIFSVLGVKLERHGTLPIKGGLLVCNHRSYLDPFLLLKDIPALPVGKIEVSRWPIVGIAGRVSGAIFVDRQNAASRKKAQKDIIAAINKGYFVINFAEGTTHSLPQTIDFKLGLFRAAAEEQFPIYPIAIEYKDENDFWVGDDTFIRHFLQCFGKKETHIKIHYGDAILGNNPEELMKMTRNNIDEKLLKLRKNWFVKN